MNKNIVLVGFMGAGKTVTSAVLALRLGMSRLSTDDQIVKEEGRSINDIFSQDGEAYFRDIESKVVHDFSNGANSVIDCGGGVVLRKENVEELKKNGMVFYLKTSPDVIYARVKNDKHRPLLKAADPLAVIKNLLAQRALFYEKADYIVVTDDKTPEEVAENIIEIVTSDK
jgi:shikimate kinase